MLGPRLVALAPLVVLLAGCGSPLNASPEPMGEAIDLGEACASEPVPTGLAPGDIAPNIVGIDQYGQEIDLYADLCDKHVILARAGFD